MTLRPGTRSTRRIRSAAGASIILIALVAAIPLWNSLRAEGPSVPASSPPGRPEAGAIRTIVLDPGHGGEEIGAIGKSGVFEKDLALDIARRLQQRLVANHGLTVILTREDDRVVPLRDRTAIANHARADLFVSIHLNSSRRHSAHGTETYFLALTASDEESMTLARAENLDPNASEGAGGAVDPNGGLDPSAAPPAPAPAPPAIPSDLEMVLWGMAQSEHIVRSSRLAEVIQDEMNRLLNVPTRGVKQAPFTVLMGATMPAVLVEVAFLSNESEETQLATAEFREKVAEAMESALTRFRNESERALTVPPAGAAPPPVP